MNERLFQRQALARLKALLVEVPFVKGVKLLARPNRHWNADWQAAAKPSDGRWTVEMAMPFASLGATMPRVGDRWGLNLTRNRWVTGSAEYMTWAVPYGSFHSPDRFGTVWFR